MGNVAMNILHGTWVPPEEKQDFEAKGFFALWVETLPSSRTRKTACTWLTGRKLKSFYTKFLDTFKFKKPELYSSERVSFLLPAKNGVPFPSPEIAGELGLEFPFEEELTLDVQKIECIKIANPVPFLSELVFFLSYENDLCQLGRDIIFWHHFVMVVKNVIQAHDYIPSLVPMKAGRVIAFAPGWEPVSRELENCLQEYSHAMPFLTRCLHGHVYEPQGLLRHFALQMVDEIVRQTPFTRKITKSVQDTFIARALEQDFYLIDDQNVWQAWKGWSEPLKKSIIDETDATFTLGFKLHPPQKDAQDAQWFMEWLAVSAKDPSYMIALEQYWNAGSKDKKSYIKHFGDNFENQLLIYLSQAARIYPAIWSGLKTNHPVGLYFSSEEAVSFLRQWAFILEDAGFKVILPFFLTPAGRRKAMLKLHASSRPASSSSSAPSKGMFGLNQILDYDFELSIGDEPVSEEEWQTLVTAKSELVYFRGEWVLLDKDEMQDILEFLQTTKQKRTSLTIADIFKIQARVDSPDFVEVEYDGVLQEALDNLIQKRLTIQDTPACLNAELREYQKRGLSWLYFMENMGLGALLADDMGLGKTIQIIALIARVLEEKGDPGLTLLVVPTSVIGNWKKEIQRFAPELKVMLHHGPDRLKQVKKFQQKCNDVHIVITSFATARMDARIIASVKWTRVVVDEAQNIKNPRSAQTKAIYKLQAKARFALTGTPVENRLLDLWSIFNFLNPGYLGTLARFKKNIETPIQRHNDVARLEQLKQLVTPFILRRIKTDKSIIKDLPEKVEQKVYCHLTREQASLYQAVVNKVEKELKQKQGIERKGLILSVLMQLKQICNHPLQFLQDGSEFTRERSHKLDRVTAMIEEIVQEGESILLFTQFKEIGSFLEKFLRRQKINTYFLHGALTRKRREKIIEEFQSPDTEPSVFILSLKAGGVGITLTKANHVLHFDRWWNPAVEDQATDRAFRIGQEKNVFVHKMVTLGTIEEKIDKMLEEKKQLAESITTADESWLTELDDNAFRELIKLSRDAVLE